MTDITAFQGGYDPEQPEKTVDVDLVLCLDATRSMGPKMALTKRRALALPEMLRAEAGSQGRRLGTLRVKVIAFRDYQVDGAYAMQLTDFFDYDTEKEELTALMSGIAAAGGGDEPENALEALAYAMDSSWAPRTEGALRRQIIAVWSDGPVHRLGTGKESPYYDPALPGSFEELTAMWMSGRDVGGRMNRTDKRMVLFAPRCKPWTVLECGWDNVTLYPSDAGRELTEADYCEAVYHMMADL